MRLGPETSSERASLGVRRTIPNLRWWIAGLLAIATALSYLDRQSFPIIVGEIKERIPISDKQYGHLTSLFLFAYALMYAGGGRLMDLLGTRVGYMVMILWWSAANFFTGTVTTLMGLGVCRFMLGMGEGGGFPGSAKAVAEWFPAKERATAFGIFNTGSSVGAVVAPPLVALIVSYLGWRWVFFLTGGLGFIWAIAWLKLYQTPVRSKFISEQELDHIAGKVGRGVPTAPLGLEAAVRRSPDTVLRDLSWFDLFSYRQVWGLMTAKFFSDAAWFFFIFWLPKYLGDVRHLNIKEIGYFAWIPYAFAGVGSMLGGWASSYLIRRNVVLDRARKIALAIGACLMPASLFIAASPLSFAIVFFSIAMFAHQFWSANVQTLPADIFPARVVGSVGGLLGSAGSFGGMLFGWLVGHLVERYGYRSTFVLAGIMHPLAFGVILLAVKRIEPLSLRLVTSLKT